MNYLLVLAAVLELLLFFVVLWLTFFLSTLVHELGHAVLSRLAGVKAPWQIRVGFGAKLLRTKHLAVNLLPFDGYFDLLGDPKLSRKSAVLTLAGGPLGSLLLFGALLALRLSGVIGDTPLISESTLKSLVNIALYVNGAIFLYSVIPACYLFGQIKGMPSDGLQIVNILKGRQTKNDDSGDDPQE